MPLLALAALLAVGLLPVPAWAAPPAAQPAAPTDQAFLRALYPWWRNILTEHGFTVVSAGKRRVYLAGDPVQACALPATASGQPWLVALAAGEGADVEQYYWRNQLLLAVVDEAGGCLTVRSRLSLASDKDFMRTVVGLEPKTMNGAPVVALRYSGADSVATPRGWRKRVAVVGVGQDGAPRVLVDFEAGYQRPVASNAPRVSRASSFSIVDIDGDGDDDVVVTSRVVTDNLWTKYTWDGKDLWKSETNE